MKKHLGSLLLCTLSLYSSTIDKHSCKGDFQIKESLPTYKVHAYEALNLTYTFQSTSKDAYIDNVLPKIDGVELFLQTTQPSPTSTRFDYTLIAENNYTIPALHIPCYSPTKQRTYTLNSPAHTITVLPLDTDSLVDKKDSLPPQSLFWPTWLPWIKGLLAFLLGYGVAAIFKKRKDER